MRGKKLLIKALVFVLCVVSLSVCLHAAAYEITLSCDYKKITENGFVADTFMGVEARYNLTGPKLYCSELIPRFCRDAYGVEVEAIGGVPRVKEGFGCRFEQVDEAEPGDVLIATGSERGKGYDHWAICKSVDPEENEMTLFEQNWRWNGCAGVNRVIPLRDSCYRVYRLVTDDGAPLPTLAERAEQEAAEQDAQEAAEQEAAMQEALAEQPVVQSSQDLLQQAIRSAELIL